MSRVEIYQAKQTRSDYESSDSGTKVAWLHASTQRPTVSSNLFHCLT